jgi:hypothetical protein
LQANSVYLIDTTLLIDYFDLNSHLDSDQKSNICIWVNDTLRRQWTDVVITPVVLCEIIRRMYYFGKKDWKTIRDIIRTMKKSFTNVKILSIDYDKIQTIIKNMAHLPQNNPCDIGEVSLLSEIAELGVIVVSSDNKVLEAYQFVNRIDPRFAPPHIIPLGQEFRP